jgi:hypothetical protein
LFGGAEDEENYGQEEEENENVAGDTYGWHSGGSSSPFWIPRTKKEIYQDAYLSFDFAMRNAIFVGNDPMTNATQEAFFDFLSMLADVLPPTWQLQWMVEDIVENMDTVLQSEEKLLEIVDKYPPRKKKWSQSCTRGKGGMGYTCGLWQLFHIMTSKYPMPTTTTTKVLSHRAIFLECWVC